jgi:hypothetical protein
VRHGVAPAKPLAQYRNSRSKVTEACWKALHYRPDDQKATSMTPRRALDVQQPENDEIIARAVTREGLV